MMDEHPILTLFLAVILVLAIVSLTPWGRTIWNNQMYEVQKADDRTNYKTIKAVEDNCRAMQASYTKDKLAYEQYKGSTSSEKQGWAEQAKMRANATAAKYNEYVLKNSFVWEENIPGDIADELPYLS